jgi:hypothetical protein
MTTDTTVLQQQTIATTTSDWSQTVTFAPFDPTLGTLEYAAISITADDTGSVSVENLGDTPTTETVSQPGTLSVFSPDGSFITSVNPDPTGSVSLAAFDGTDDYAGTSGATLSNLSSTASSFAYYYPTASDLALLSGSDSVPLTVDASVMFDEAGSGNLQALSHASAGAVVSLQYVYIPYDDGTGDTTTTIFEAPLLSTPIRKYGDVFSIGVSAAAEPPATPCSPVGVK